MLQLKTGFDPEKMREDIVRWVTESRTHYQSRFNEVDEFVKRYEARRSIAGLMGWGDDPKVSPKDQPWASCSDIGIPIEAFTIEGLLPRFLKVCYGAKPIVWVKGESEDDLEQAPTVQDALNFQLTKKMKIYRRMKNVFKNVVMAGDAFAKCIWEKEDKLKNRIAYYIADANTNEPILDEQGKPTEVEKDVQIEPINPLTGVAQIVIKKIISEQVKVYDGPRVYSRNIRQIVIPKDANTAEIDELDWLCDQYERTIDWLKRKIGDPEEGGFDERAVQDLEQDVLARPSTTIYGQSHNFRKVLISEWHGKYDVNDDGLDEEVVVFIGSVDLTGTNAIDAVKNSKLLSWMISPYPSRPFFHYQIIPMDNSFYGKGVPEFLIGIRNLVDAVFNQMVDRGSISNNPPVIVPPDHDPDENPYGPGVQWPSDNPGAYRALELPKSEQLEFSKMEFLLALVQKLFGVTDFTPPPAMGQQRTATGIMTIVSEGNIKFDDMIRALQDVNEDLYDFIVQLNSELLEDEFIYRISDAKNPFKKVARRGWVGNYDFEAVGNSININREIEQNRAILAYTTGMNSYGKNPAITPEVMLKLTDNFFTAIDMRNIKLPTVQELQQQRIAEMAQAIVQAEQIRQQQLAQTLAKGAGRGQPAGVQTGQAVAGL